MEKKPVAIISNDWHIDHNNVEIIVDLFSQKVELANKLGVKELFILGDIFQSRQSQQLVVLKCFEQILEICREEGVDLHVIPGNHDKTNYKSQDSFLDSFNWHPNLKLYRDFGAVVMPKVYFHLIPFFDNDIWLEKFKEADSFIKEITGKTRILLSHIALNGSVNNDGSKVESPLSYKLFKNYNSVFLGHYHNHQQVAEGVYHLPSIRQKNYGEDEDKGFSVIYQDGSYEVHKSKFKPYRTIKIDLDKTSKKELDEIIVDNALKDSNIRFKFTGTEDKIKSINFEELYSFGYDVKTEHKDVVASIESVKNGEIIEFNNSSIFEEFEKFCEKEEYTDSQIGLSYLKTILR